MQEKLPLLKDIIHIHNRDLLLVRKIYFAALFAQIYSRQIYLSTINNLLLLTPKKIMTQRAELCNFTYSSDSMDMN